jgi:hypothetical protein
MHLCRFELFRFSSSTFAVISTGSLITGVCGKTMRFVTSGFIVSNMIVGGVVSGTDAVLEVLLTHVVLILPALSSVLVLKI